MTSAENAGTERWVCCYWQENFADLGNVPLAPGHVAPGVLMLPPPVGDLAQARGLWTMLNAELGTLIDVGEEEDIPAQHLERAASVVTVFADQIGDSKDVLKEKVGEKLGPIASPMTAGMSVSSFLSNLGLLSDFFSDASKKQKAITISL